MAGAAWLIDYAVAVVFSARDSLRPSAAQRDRADAWSTEALFLPALPTTDNVVRVLRPGRFAASLGLIGVLGVSVLGALWRESAPASAPAMDAGAEAVQTPAQRSLVALAWAPLVPVDPLISEPGTPLSAVTSDPARNAAAEVAASPVSAAAVPEPSEATSTPEPAPPSAAPAPEPEPPPPPPPAVPAPTPNTQLTRAQVAETALLAGWPTEELDELLSVAWCESRFRVDANGWGALGLMQIMPEWFQSLGIDVSWAFDPTTNLRVAYHIHQNDLRNGYGEWASWTCKPAGLPENAP